MREGRLRAAFFLAIVEGFTCASTLLANRRYDLPKRPGLRFCSRGFPHARAFASAWPVWCCGRRRVSPGPDEALAEGGAGAIETRYFTAIDGLMDGNADVILKETRQGKTVTAAVLDVCYPADKSSDRKDRFVVNLAVNGQTLTRHHRRASARSRRSRSS